MELNHVHELLKLDTMSDINKWRILSLHLKELKAVEMALRRAIAGKILMGMKLPAKDSVMIGPYHVQAENGVTYNIDNAVLDSIWQELSPEEKATIKHEPKLMLLPYKKIPDEDKKLLKEAITIKPSAPTLTIL